MNNKKIISATLLVSDGPVENEYFYELLQIQQKDLINLFEEINNELENLEFGFYIRFDLIKSDNRSSAIINFSFFIKLSLG